MYKVKIKTFGKIKNLKNVETAKNISNVGITKALKYTSLFDISGSKLN